MIGRAGFLLLLALVALSFTGCGGRMPEDLGAHEGEFKACPASPNCVSSFATDQRHRIEALSIEGAPAAAWRALEAELASRPRVEIAKRSDDYLHAVFTTRIVRYRDDVEFFMNAVAGRIEIRSASRVGYGDMDANRSRIESIRSALVARGVLRAAAAD